MESLSVKLVVPIVIYLLLIFYLINRHIHLSRLSNLKNENLKEEINTLSQQINEQKNIKSSLEQKTIYYNYLKEISDKMQHLSLEDLCKDLVDYVFRLLSKNRGSCLLYLVDPDRKNLNLFLSKKEYKDLVIKQKKGDIFDSWVVKHASSLLIEDTRADFRFDLEKIESGLKRPVMSLISSPLKVEQKFLGLLRSDNDNPHFYTQDDLRFLDAICNVGALGLENALLFRHTQELSIRDSLTGLYTKGFYLDRLNDHIQLMLRQAQKNLSLLMIDIDNFKEYNDRYGHIAGDIVLKGLGKLFSDFFAPIHDAMVCRFGGEEFSIFFPDLEKSQAQDFAEGLRKAVEQKRFILRLVETKVTISLGLAFLTQSMRIAQDLILKADSALYRAKQKGKNQLCII